MADPIGYASLQIIPVMAGIKGNLEGQLGGPLVAAGKRVGKATGEAVASGIAESKALVEKASSDLAKANDKVADSAGRVRAAEARVVELRRQGKGETSAAVAAEERLAKAKRDAAAASKTAEGAADQLAAAEKRAASAADDTGSKVGGVVSGLKSYGGGLDTAAKKAMGFAAATAGIGGAMSLAFASMDNAKVKDKLAASLGASPAVAKKYGDEAGRLYANGLGDSMSDTAAAVGAVSTAFRTLGYEGETSLNQAATRALNFSETFDADMAESVQTASQLVTNGLAKDSTEAFDLMTTSFQKVPIAMRGELPEILNEYGTNFRALGFQGPEAFNLLVAAADKGKFALDKTGDALKEFTIRGSDMSKTSVDAYRAIGLNAQEMSDKIAAGGPGAQSALQATAKGLLSIQNPADRANTAIALFGTPLEDLSVDQIPAFLEAMSGSENAMSGFQGSTDRLNDVLNGNASSALDKFTRQIQTGLIGVLESSALWIQNNVGLAQTFAVTAGVLGAAWLGYKAVMVGVQVASAASAAASATATGVSWAAAQVAASAGWVAMQARAIGAFVATAASSALQAGITSAAWVASQIAASAGWLAMQAAAIGSFVATAASSTLQAGISAAAWVASNVRTAASFVLTRGAMAATTIATGAMTAAQWLLNVALNANPIGLVVMALAALVGGIVLAYQNSETFRNIVQAAWQGIQTAVSFAWDSVIKPALTYLGEKLTEVGQAVKWLWENAVQPTFSVIGDLISGTWNNVIQPAFESMKSGFGSVGDFFSGVGDTIGAVWDGIVSGIKASVRVIGNVIKGAGNAIAWAPGNHGEDLQKTGDELISWSGMKTGGLFRGAGTGTSDSNLIAISDREFVVNAAATSKTLPILEAINSGWVPPADFLHQMVPGFATGGLVDAQNFARGESGKPYQYGGVGNPSWDCSGFMSGIYAILTGKDPNTRYFTTESDFDSMGFVKGLGGPGDFSIGVMRGGGGPNSHMGGTLGDLDVESGSNGVLAGDGAMGASDFPLQWHLPLSGDPGGMAGGGGGFDFGGLGSRPGGGGSAPSRSGSTPNFGTGGGGASTARAGVTQVFVTNWPSGQTNTLGQPQTDGQIDENDPAGRFKPLDAPQSAPIGGTGVDSQYTDGNAASWQETTSKNFNDGMVGAGKAFLDGQLAGMPFGDTLGKVRDRGNQITIIVQDMHEAISKIRTLDKQQALAPGSRF